MLYRFRNKFKKAWFNARCRHILETRPLPAADSDVVVLSAVGNQDVLMYLVAIKSFYHFFGRGRAMLLVQDDCPAANLAILQKHVRPLHILRDSDVELGKCPRGGTWERLITIAREAQERYVIQLDSDTLTVAPIEDVNACVAANQSFMIGTWARQQIDSMEVARARAKDSDSNHVQMLAEQRFDRLPGYAWLKYARGQSSFAGFAKRSCSFDALEQFSEQMQEIVGHAKWREWGSESLASNFLVANAPDATILPHPKYSTYTPPETDGTSASLIHFEGTNRFKNELYVQRARRMIDTLRSQ